MNTRVKIDECIQASVNIGPPSVVDGRPGLRYSWDLVTHLVAREFRVRYRQALLGWLWAVGSPLTRLVILTYIFTEVLPLGIENYAVFAFTGLIAWHWFSSGVSSACTSAVDRRELLLRPGIPRTAVPVVSVLVDGLDYLAALPVLAAFLLLGEGLSPAVAVFPLILLFQFLLTAGFGFALCTANVYVRDVHLFVNVATLVGWYVTPVFYHPDAVPEGYRWVLHLNPMAHLLAAYRMILIHGVVPAVGEILGLGAICLVIFIAGYFIFRAASPLFVDEL